MSFAGAVRNMKNFFIIKKKKNMEFYQKKIKKRRWEK